MLTWERLPSRCSIKSPMLASLTRGTRHAFGSVCMQLVDRTLLPLFIVSLFKLFSLLRGLSFFSEPETQNGLRSTWGSNLGSLLPEYTIMGYSN